MKLLLIRHGEPTYTEVRKRRFRAHGLDLAPLTPEGKEQIKLTAKDPRLKAAEMILSSPYTRALQTASILATHLQLPIEVEVGLHEWLPDLSFRYQTKMEMNAFHRNFYKQKGIYTDGEPVKWESLSMIQTRVTDIFDQYYRFYETLIVACHSMVIKSVAFQKKVAYGEIVELDYHPGQPLAEWTFED